MAELTFSEQIFLECLDPHRSLLHSPAARRRWFARAMAAERQSSLPQDRIPFVGRAKTLARIESALESGQRCLVLTGSGGMGKSRLAREVARRFIAHEWPVFFLDASWVEDADDLLAATQHAVGLAEEGLLVLDNLRVGPDELFTQFPHLQLLITSRSSLQRPPREVVRLGLLSARDSADLLGHFGGRRAGVARVPLALILAGAVLSAQADAQIRSIPATTGVLTKEQVLMASVSQLDQPAFLKLLCLCTIVGSFHDADAADVARAVGVDTDFEPLVSLSLVQRTAPGLLQVHDDIRSQVLRAAAGPLVQRVNNAHAQVFEARARLIASAVLSGSWVEATREMLRSRLNFRQALRHVWQVEQFESVKVIARGLSRPLFEAGYLADFREFAERGVGAGLATGDRVVELELLGLQGALAGRESEDDVAARLWNRRLQSALDLGDYATALDAYGDLAHMAFDQKDFGQAIITVDDALTVMETFAHDSHEATLRSIRCRSLLALGQADEAEQELDAIEAILPRCTDPVLLPFVHYSLGLLYLELDRPAEAETMIRAVIGQSVNGQQVVGLGWALRNLGEMAEARNDLNLAAKCFVAATLVFNEYETKHQKRARESLHAFEDRHGLRVADEVVAAAQMNWPDLVATI